MIILAALVVVIAAWLGGLFVRSGVSAVTQSAGRFARRHEELAGGRSHALTSSAIVPPRFPAPGLVPQLSARTLSLEAVAQMCRESDVDPERSLPAIFSSDEFNRDARAMPLAVALSGEGTPLVMDLASAPHILVGGTTGSGKSFLQHAFIASLIHRHGPRTLRLLLVDTKGLELAPYAALPHLRHRVATQPAEALEMLRWMNLESSRRMALLGANHCRGIAEFNDLVRNGDSVLVQPAGGAGHPPRVAGSAPDAYLGDVIPYLVFLVDDVADISARHPEFQTLLSGIAQAGRAVGIHLICVTQRPSVNIVAGDVKALFPARIAFRLPAAVDSRAILDQGGAERLDGSGAMIVVSSDRPKGQVARGLVVTSRMVDLVARAYQNEDGGSVRHPTEMDIIAEIRAAGAAHEPDDGPSLRDPLFHAAAELCVQNGSGSTSLLQRRLGIGYGRAARLIDQLSDAGILDAAGGPAGRGVRVTSKQLDGLR